MIIMNKVTHKVIFDAKENRMQSEIKKKLAVELKEVAK